MPLPLAPLIPLALRVGAVAATGIAASRWLRNRSFPGRTDQRAEDALDDQGEGFSLHQPSDLAESKQTNAGFRVKRVIRFRGKSYELDAGLLARLRLREKDE